MYRYLKSKAGKNIPQPKQNRSSLGEIRNGTRRRYNESFKRRGSLINAFTRGKQRTQHRTKIKTGSRADVIAAATKDLDVQKLDTKQKEVVILLFRFIFMSSYTFDLCCMQLDLILEGKNVFFTGSAGFSCPTFLHAHHLNHPYQSVICANHNYQFTWTMCTRAPTFTSTCMQVPANLMFYALPSNISKRFFRAKCILQPPQA